MKPSAKILVSLSVLVLFACTKSPAQDSDLPQGIAWRKQVARELEFSRVSSGAIAAQRPKSRSSLMWAIAGLAIILLGALKPFDGEIVKAVLTEVGLLN